MSGAPAMQLLRFISAGIFAAAGFAAFLMLLNRVLLHLSDRPCKRPLIHFVFAGIVICSAAAGYAAGFSAWLFLPLLFFGALALGEMRRAAIRRKCEAPGPINTETVGVSLLRPFTTMDLALRHYEIRDPEWRFRRFRVVHVSDLHLTDRLPYDYYRTVMDRAVNAGPDALFLTGDFVTRAKFAPLLPGILAGCGAKFGTFAVLGNHDHWSDSAEVGKAISSCGINLLSNTWQRVEIGDDCAIVISGCEDPWGPGKWRTPPASGGEPLLIITHTPDNIYKLSKASPAAVFAGHYHGGQMRLPLLGSLAIPSKYGRRFDHGHFLVNGVHLFVSAGVGAASPPLRIYCRPEILIVDFEGGPAGTAEPGNPGNPPRREAARLPQP